MDIDLLSRMISELIVDHDQVGLPGVGTFVAEMVPATFSDKGYTINPPYRRLSFYPSRLEPRPNSTLQDSQELGTDTVPTGQPGRPCTALPQLSHRQHPAVSGHSVPAAWHLPPRTVPRAYPGLGLQEHVALHVLAGFAVGHASLPHGIFAGIQRRRDVDTGSLASALTPG